METLFTQKKHKNYERILYKKSNIVSALALQIGYKAIREDQFYFYENNLHAYTKASLGNSYTKKIEEAKKILDNLERTSIDYIPFFDESYPYLLKEMDSFPAGLFIRGKKDLIQKNKKLSIVGTRNPSPLSVIFTEWISNYLSSHGVTIVSGFALGIDTVAHRASIQSSGGTIGVLAHGLDFIYPKSNFDLYSRSDNPKENLLLISEHPPGVKPLKFHFPKRNAIIAGLSKSIFHIEGSIRSGAGITIRHALDAGRDVGVFDHPILKNNTGGRKFIEEGAHNIASYGNIMIQKESINQLKEIIKHNFNFIGNAKWAKVIENQKSNELIPKFCN